MQDNQKTTEESDKNGIEESAISDGTVFTIVKDRTKLKGRLAKKFAGEDDPNYQPAFGIDTVVHEFIKPLKTT